MIEVITPTTPEHLDAVRALIRAFVAWHHERYREDLALIVPGLLALLTACASPSTPTATVPPPGSALPYATDTLFPVSSIVPSPVRVTDLPSSASHITVTLETSSDIVHVGENFTMTVTVNNTGQLPLLNTECTLLYAIGDIGTAQPTDDPVFTLISEDIPLAHGKTELVVGERQICIFVLRAERPESLLLQGSYGGKVLFATYETYGGNVSEWTRVRIEAAKVSP